MPDHEPRCYADHVGTGDSKLFASGQRSDGTLLVGPGVAVYVGERPPLRSLGRVVAWVSGPNSGRGDAVGPRVLVGGEALDARDRTAAAGRIVFVDERTAAGRLLGLTRGQAPSVRVPKDTSLDLREERRTVARLFGALGFEADGFVSDDFAELVAPLEMRGLASSDARRGERRRSRPEAGTTRYRAFSTASASACRSRASGTETPAHSWRTARASRTGDFAATSARAR